MDFEWKQRIVFMFVVAVPITTIMGMSVSPYEGIILSRNPEKVRILQEYYASKIKRIPKLVDGFDDLPTCVSKTRGQGSVAEIPQSFDGRIVWANCPSLWEIRDQGSCSSWASAMASVMTDRFCVASNGTIQFRFSSFHLISCAKDQDDDAIGTNCQSASIAKIWNYVEQFGGVSGGPFGCKRSEVESCDHSTPNSCSSNHGQTFHCVHECNNPTFSPFFDDDERHVLDPCRLQNNHDLIKLEIMESGPVLAIMDLFDDLFLYNASMSGGIYTNRKSDGEKIGTHAVKIVGWGQKVVNGMLKKYWIVANSFGYEWGDSGFFLVDGSISPTFGAAITRHVTAATPDFSPPAKHFFHSFSKFLLDEHHS